MDKKKRVLVVEDDNGIRLAISSILERQGYEGKLTNASQLCQDAIREFETIRHFLESYLTRQGELASKS